ncbi:LCP family protein [Blastococcus sp. TBT05-19]|uniref:LCP family protein n=1 Tax=Blastococcus sp. TBT05-19 TaxID=2250581 RepID=UPI001F4147C7|nr:LCP family protein [Blastococcus sp. TBT05-19]
MTVEQLLARQGEGVGRRRASRRAAEPRAEAPARRAAEPRAGAPARRAPVARGPETPAARSDESPAVRAGLPPVPGAVRPARPAGGSTAAPEVQPGPPPLPALQPGLPPVPAAAPAPAPIAPAVQAGLPPVPGSSGASLWAPAERPSRRSGPIPPLPGIAVPPAPPVERPTRAEARPPRSAGRRRAVRVATALVALLGVVVLYHLALYFYVDQRIDRVDALATDGPEVLAAELQDAAETYLVVGTGVPGQTGAASVATLVASVSAEGDRAVLVSVPPTAMIDTPVCRTPDGDLRNPVTEAFASSLLDGGPACMVRAVQQLSGLRIDHYLGVDLAGLPAMVDALGGVPVCVVPSEATAAAAEPPPAGPSQLTGSAAAGFLAPGDSGTDVTGAAVAERAQRLLTSTLRGAMSIDTLLDPVALATFLNRASDSLTVDEQTTLGDLRELAGSLGNLSGDAVQRAGLPVAQVGYVPAGTDEAYVVLDAPATRSLFDAVIDDTRLPAEVLEAQRAAQTAASQAAEAPQPAPEQPAGPPPLTAAPGQITVDVLNGTATTGLAGTVADALRAQGFGVGTVGNEEGTVNETVVRFGPGAEEQARTVAAAVPNSVLRPSDAVGAAVQLVIGPGYSTVVPVQVGGPAAVETAAQPAPADPQPEAEPVSC